MTTTHILYTFTAECDGKTYSGYINEMPNVFAVGETFEQLKENLATALHHALKYHAEKQLNKQ